ncbi:MAG: sigma-54 dependent transcriptional regulator [Planctomycetes bacterium]|nr:sigma-54 dependent transcriptional regulator [Planctomycetota bacterium]
MPWDANSSRPDSEATVLVRSGGGSSTTEVTQPTGGRILIVDDDRVLLNSLADFMRREGHEGIVTTSVTGALQTLDRNSCDLVISDVKTPADSDFELLRAVHQRWPDLLVVIVTAAGTIESAVRAVKLGAFDYLTKPINEGALRLLIQRALRHASVLRENRALRRQLEDRKKLDNVIGQTYRMQRVFDLVEAVADSKATVLMHGETGTGKSLIARSLHYRSHRRERPFVEVSCGAIPETLLESELFGHVKGAFTGALADKQGKFRYAEGGTVFLDEIPCASPASQAKLLRILQDKQFEPLGSNQTFTADVRVILATNVDLQKEVAEGRFREDLYYRINVVNIELPPLRERLADIPILAEHFLAHYCQQHGRRVLGFSEEVLQYMQRYHWPGNVRELENCVERAVVLTRNRHILKEDLPPQLLQTVETKARLLAASTARPLPLKDELAEPERRIIQAALDANEWNRGRTAEVLSINRTTLYKKMKRYGLLSPNGGRC